MDVNRFHFTDPETVRVILLIPNVARQQGLSPSFRGSVPRNTY